MTAAVVAAGADPPRPPRRILLWLVPLTILWIVLIYWQPTILTAAFRLPPPD